MRKGWIVLLACALIAFVAAPALAVGVDVTGLYRAKGYVSNYKDYGAGQRDPDLDNAEVTNSYVEQRLRFKFSAGDENVKAFWFTEIDPIFGIGSGQNGARNQGGALNGDSINVETKNLYLWFKIPNTSFDFTVGLQNQSDSYAGLFFGGADMSGIFSNFKFDPVAVRIGWAKLFEGGPFAASVATGAEINSAVGQDDDVDLWLAEVKFVPTTDVKVGANFYFINDHGVQGPGPANPLLPENGSFKLYMPGVDVALKAGPATISAFAFYQTGTVEEFGVADIDVSAWAVDARADLNLGPGKLFVEGLYTSGGDGTGTDIEAPITLSNYVASESFYTRTDMMIMLNNIDDISTNQNLVNNPFNGGRGIWHVAAGYAMKLTDQLGFKVGAGYLSSTEEFVGDNGSNIGTEVNANINYNIAKGLDFGLYGAYVFLGDAFDPDPGDPELVDPYDLHFRLNYAF